MLELGYLDLSQSEARLIRNHYRGQDNGHQPFQLSTLAWAGHTSLTDLVPATTYWRYVAQPEETQKNGGFVDVSVQLESVI